MKYLLVLPKDSAKSSGGYNVFPVGIAYVSAYLKAHRHDVYTANLEFFAESTYDALKRLIEDHSIDMVCTAGLSRDYPRVKEIIDIARIVKPSILTLVGGGIVSGDPQPAMQALGADIGVVGQGEITMQELAAALDNNLPYAHIPGLIFKVGDQYQSTCVRAEIKDLDAMPFPDYDGFAFAEYMRQIDYEVAFVIASRSCPFKCTFCFHPSGDKYRKRSLDNLFLEIDYLVNTYHVRNVVVSDELFAPKRDRVIDFCRRIKPYNVQWSVQLRVCDVDEELLAIMRDSGCLTISYGIESADDAILTSMAKKITVAQIDEALKLTYAANIDIQGGLIFGDVAENTETVANSLHWYDNYPQYGLELNMINIFPGTGLYNHAVASGIVRDRVKFLTDGCPLINVSKLSDSEYKNLSSEIYERNMRAKYQPAVYEVYDIREDGGCRVALTCGKCGEQSIFAADLLHIHRFLCEHCRQRYYVDPFQKLLREPQLPEQDFSGEGRVALWGAGELCIKLIDHYKVLEQDKFIVVDYSKSRQGYSVCGKPIFSTDYINQQQIKSVILTVVKRKREILRQLAEYTCVERVYLPGAEKQGDRQGLFKMTRIV